MKARVIYYGGIADYLPKGQSGRLILREGKIIFKGPGIGPCSIPISRIKKARIIQEYIHAVYVIILAIDYHDKDLVPRTLKVRIRAFGWPGVLKRSNLWAKEINRLIKR